MNLVAHRRAVGVYGFFIVFLVVPCRGRVRCARPGVRAAGGDPSHVSGDPRHDMSGRTYRSSERSRIRAVGRSAARRSAHRRPHVRSASHQSSQRRSVHGCSFSVPAPAPAAQPTRRARDASRRPCRVRSCGHAVCKQQGTRFDTDHHARQASLLHDARSSTSKSSSRTRRVVCGARL